MNFLAFLPNVFSGDGILILLAVLVLFGAKRIPELARGFGQAINEFNKAKDDVHRQITAPPEPPVQAPSTPSTVSAPEANPVAQDQKPTV